MQMQYLDATAGPPCEMLYTQSRPRFGLPAAPWAHGCIPWEYQRHRFRITRPLSGFRAPFQPCTLWQQGRPSNDMVFEVFVRDLVFGPLHPPAHRDTGLVTRVGVPGNKGVPPIEVASLGHHTISAPGR